MTLEDIISGVKKREERNSRNRPRRRKNELHTIDGDTIDDVEGEEQDERTT